MGRRGYVEDMFRLSTNRGSERRAPTRRLRKAAVTALVFASLVSGPTGTASATATPVGTVAAAPWSSRVISAGGVRQWFSCSGSGRFTVVVIPGLNASHRMWSRVLRAFAATTRTCIYDRPGLGGSPPLHPHRTVSAATQALELWALLVAARERAPLIIVGHSYGGLVARTFVARYHRSVAGLMLIEGVAPYDRVSHYWHEGGDRIDVWASSRAAARLRPGSIPLVVEAAQDPNRNYWGASSFGASASDIADWRAHQRAAASLSTNSTFLIVRHSAHVIEHDQPAAVIAGVRLLVLAVRHHHRLLRCALGRYGSQPLCR